MKALLTGGAGYIGTHTAVAMLNAGHEIVVVDNLCNSCQEAVNRVEEITGKKIKLYVEDVARCEAIKELLSTEQPDCVIHFAGLKAVGESVEKPIEYYRNNIDATLSLLEAMKASGVHKLVFSSSATVYGENNQPPFLENMEKGMCTNPYGWTKWMQEQMLTDAAKADDRLSVVLLRYFNPVGAHESGLIGEDPQGIPNNLMPFISQVAVGYRERLTVFGNDYDTPDGSCRRDFIHVMDLAEGHVKAAEFALENKGTEIFNLGTGNPCSVFELIQAFESASGRSINYVIGDRRKGDVQDSWANSDKAREILDWQASRTIYDMCNDAWNWQSKNPQGY